MEKVMTNGFCELNENEMMMVDGGAGRVDNAIKTWFVSTFGTPQQKADYNYTQSQNAAASGGTYTPIYTGVY